MARCGRVRDSIACKGGRTVLEVGESVRVTVVSNSQGNANVAGAVEGCGAGAVAGDGDRPGVTDCTDSVLSIL